MKRRLFYLLLLVAAIVLVQTNGSAQLKLGVTPSVINKSSILELESKVQGLLLTRVPDTLVSPLTSAPDGTIIFFTKDNTLRIRKNGIWQQVIDPTNFWKLNNINTAGGDLTGTYPDPLVAPNAITNAKLADNSVSTTKIIDGNVTTVKLADQSVTSLKLADNSVITAKILDGNVTTAKLADQSVTSLKLADNSVITAKILDGNVTTTKLADQSVTSLKLADNSVITAKILDGNVTTTKLADQSVTYAKIQNVTNNTLLGRYATTPGAAQEIKIGTGLSLDNTTGTLSATSASGTVTKVTASGSSGFAVSVTNPTTTPDIKIATNLYGFLKGDGYNLTSTNSNTIDLVNDVSGTLPITKGGTGINWAGSAYQLVRMNSSGTAYDYFTPTYLTMLGLPAGFNVSYSTSGTDRTATISTYLNGIVRASGAGGFSTGAIDLTSSTDVNGILPITSGGTGINYKGSALQLLRMNAGASGLEYFTPNYLTAITATVPSGLSATITPSSGSSNIGITTTLNGLLRGNGSGFTTGTANLATEVTGTLPTANGGTGLSTIGSSLNLLRVNSAGTALEYVSPAAVLNNTSWLMGGNSVTSEQNLGTTSNFDVPVVANNQEKMRITTSGNVGIATSAPGAKLDVAGDFKLGQTGTVLTGILKFSTPGNTTIPNIGGQTTKTVSVTNANVLANASVIVNVRGGLADGLVVASSYATAGSVTIKITNITSGNLGPYNNLTFDITVIQ